MICKVAFIVGILLFCAVLNGYARTVPLDTDSNEVYFNTLDGVFSAKNLPEWSDSKMQQMQCPDEFTLIAGKCLKYSIGLQYNWFEAKLTCRSLNASLAAIKNSAEMAALSENLIDYRSRLTENGFWIDANDISAERKFYSDFWDSGENKNCVQIHYVKGDYHINDYSCMEKSNFICETAPVDEEAVEVKHEPKQIICPAKFTPLGEKCYQFKDVFKGDWFDAALFCMDANADLVKIESSSEMAALSKHLVEMNQRKHYWIANDDFDYNFDSEEKRMPNAELSQDEVCLQLELIDGEYKINVNDCWAASAVICERKPLMSDVEI